MVEDNSNIIEFPIRNSDQDAEFDFAEEYAKAVLSNLLDSMNRMGLDTRANEEELLPMSMMVFETIKALYLKGSGIYHPIQDIADELFDELED